MTETLSPTTPGDILFHEFMEPLSISQNQLARDLNVPVPRINEIVNGKRAITADTALRLARYFGTSAQFWLNLQQRYDLKIAAAKLGAEIERTVKPLSPSAPTGASA
jgi:addiction module HigA family antidote